MRDLGLVRVQFSGTIIERSADSPPEPPIDPGLAEEIESLLTGGTDGDPRNDDLAYPDGKAPRFKRESY